MLSSPYFSAPFLPVPKSPLIHRKYEMASFGGSLELSHRFFLWSDREPSFVCIEPHVVMWIFVSETWSAKLLPRKFKTAYQNSQPFSAREIWILREIWMIKLSSNSSIKTKPIFSLFYNPHNHTSTSHTGIIQTCSYSKLLESRSAFILFPSYLRDHSWPLYQAEFVLLLLNFEI